MLSKKSEIKLQEFGRVVVNHENDIPCDSCACDAPCDQIPCEDGMQTIIGDIADITGMNKAICEMLGIPANRVSHLVLTLTPGEVPLVQTEYRILPNSLGSLDEYKTENKVTFKLVPVTNFRVPTNEDKKLLNQKGNEDSASCLDTANRHSGGNE